MVTAGAESERLIDAAPIAIRGVGLAHSREMHHHVLVGFFPSTRFRRCLRRRRARCFVRAHSS